MTTPNSERATECPNCCVPRMSPGCLPRMPCPVPPAPPKKLLCPPDAPRIPLKTALRPSESGDATRGSADPTTAPTSHPRIFRPAGRDGDRAPVRNQQSLQLRISATTVCCSPARRWQSCENDPRTPRIRRYLNYNPESCTTMSAEQGPPVF